MIRTIHIGSLRFEGGGAFPEQYDVFREPKLSEARAPTEKIAYCRLRHGEFTVECADAWDTLVLEAKPKGNGEFYDDERHHWLNEAAKAIEKHYAKVMTE